MKSLPEVSAKLRDLGGVGAVGVAGPAHEALVRRVDWKKRDEKGLYYTCFLVTIVS